MSVGAALAHRRGQVDTSHGGRRLGQGELALSVGAMEQQELEAVLLTGLGGEMEAETLVAPGGFLGGEGGEKAARLGGEDDGLGLRLAIDARPLLVERTEPERAASAGSVVARVDRMHTHRLGTDEAGRRIVLLCFFLCLCLWFLLLLLWRKRDRVRVREHGDSYWAQDGRVRPSTKG